MVIHCFSASGSVPASASGSTGSPASSRIISAARRTFSSPETVDENRASVPMNRLSTTVLSSATSTSW